MFTNDIDLSPSVWPCDILMFTNDISYEKNNSKQETIVTNELEITLYLKGEEDGKS